MRTHDNTMMSAFSTCERLYALRFVLNRKPGLQRPALSFGGLVHTGLAAIYRSFSDDDLDSSLRDVVQANERCEEALRAADFEDPEDDYRTLARAELLLLNYLHHYVDDTDIGEIRHIETGHDAEIAPGFRWGGIIDLWAGSYRGGGLHIFDHKTTSRYGGDHYFDEYYRSPQMILYLLSAAALTGEWPEGVVINVLINRKVGTRASPKFQFARKRITFPDWLVHEAKRMQEVNYELIETKLELHEHETDVWDPAIWKPNLYSCTGKYGRCDMYDVCHSIPENREQVLLQETEEEEWDWRKVRE